MSEIDDLVETLVAWKHAKADAEEMIAETQAKLMAVMEAQGKSKVTTQRGKATVVRPTRLHIDEERLHSHLDEDVWDRITRRVVDKDKLESAVSLDLVDAELVADCTDERPTKPYIKVTER
jgi:hypothetical protein